MKNKKMEQKDTLLEKFNQTKELINYLIENKIASKKDTMESIFYRLISSGDGSKKEKIKPIKKEKIDIPKKIREECHKNEDIFILSMDKNFSFLLKRKEEVITTVLGEGTMNIVEQQNNVIFFDCFALFWTLTKNDKPIPQLEKLKEYGFPVYHVETEHDISSGIESA